MKDVAMENLIGFAIRIMEIITEYLGSKKFNTYMFIYINYIAVNLKESCVLRMLQKKSKFFFVSGRSRAVIKYKLGRS